MNHRESFSVEFMQRMLIDCVKEKKEIEKRVIKDVVDISNDWGITTEAAVKRVHSQFNPISGKTEDINPFKENEKAIKALTIAIAKKEKMINLESWEAKYTHATENVRIEDVVRYYLKEDNFKRRVKCPFHESKGGKHLQVYEKTNSYHCFSCKASGSPVQFVMRIENCDFKEAVEILDKF